MLAGFPCFATIDQRRLRTCPHDAPRSILVLEYDFLARPCFRSRKGKRAAARRMPRLRFATSSDRPIRPSDLAGHAYEHGTSSLDDDGPGRSPGRRRISIRCCPAPTRSWSRSPAAASATPISAITTTASAPSTICRLTLGSRDQRPRRRYRAECLVVDRSGGDRSGGDPVRSLRRMPPRQGHHLPEPENARQRHSRRLRHPHHRSGARLVRGRGSVGWRRPELSWPISRSSPMR